MNSVTETATVTSKGQVTIPIAVRKDLTLIPGSKLEFIPDGDGTWRVVKKTRSIMDLAGVIKSKTGSPSVENMDETARLWVVENYFESLKD